MKKRIVAMVLSLTIVLSGGVSTFAAEIENQSDTVETEKVELSGEESDISSESEDVTSTKNVQLDSQLNTDNEAEKVQLKLDESASEEKDASKPQITLWTLLHDWVTTTLAFASNPYLDIIYWPKPSKIPCKIKNETINLIFMNT